MISCESGTINAATNAVLFAHKMFVLPFNVELLL